MVIEVVGVVLEMGTPLKFRAGIVSLGYQAPLSPIASDTGGLAGYVIVMVGQLCDDVAIFEHGYTFL